MRKEAIADYGANAHRAKSTKRTGSNRGAFDDPCHLATQARLAVSNLQAQILPG
jgi:hypothetical protein